MSAKKLVVRLGVSGLLLTGSLSLAATAPEQAGPSCVSAQCHATLVKAKNVHPPVESCDACHVSVEATHPQKGKKTFKLTQEPPALCESCHDALGKKAVVHPPVKEGMCTTCHDPHSSNEPKLLAQPLKDLCGSCHTDKTSFKILHGPVSAGDCTACHTPHESDAKGLLVKEGPSLCTGCHADLEEQLKSKGVHPALEAGCTSCHNPHGSAYPKLLADEGPKVCFACHDAIAGKIEKGSSVHPPVASEKACASCHSPHASNNATLLLEPEKTTCLGCHATVLAKTMTSLHGPIREGRCTVCHDPHASPFPKLLAAEFPPDSYAPYTDTEFALCFGCHKRDLLQYPDTSFATNFRDGERNLHYLHVNDKQKGRSCILCHDVHGAGNPSLIADSVAFGKWRLPLRFVKTETGGSCSPGCHRPQAYDRKVPGRKPEPKALRPDKAGAKSRGDGS